MRFLIDAQLPPTLHGGWPKKDTKQNTSLAWPCRRRPTRRSGLRSSASAAIVSKDEDFAQRKVLTGQGPTVIWIRLLNARRQDLLKWFEAVLPDLLAALERGETPIEVI
jgi:predicted nuclease of predicted toxin-antitoxin system